MDKNDEFKLRRRMAITSFIFILLITIYILYKSTNACLDIVANLQAAGSILTPIIACLTGLILGYGAAVTIRDRDNDNDNT